MATKTIPELTLISAVDDDCLFPTDDTIKTYRATAPQIYNYIKDKEKEVIQDYTLINTVGTASQQEALSLWEQSNGGYNEPGSPWADLLAYYKFANGAMTTDTKGSYDLTDPGGANSPSNANGIFGSDYAAYFDGGDYYTQATLLDSPSGLSNGLLIEFIFKADDGQVSSDQYIFRKNNDETGGNEDELRAFLYTDKTLRITAKVGGTRWDLRSNQLNDGATPWHYVAIVWNSTVGLELYVDGIRHAAASDCTSFMADGTTRDFIIGANNNGGSIGDEYTGYLTQFRVRDIVATAKDIMLSYATKYSTPTVYTDLDFLVQALIKRDGDDNFVSAVNWADIEIMRNDSYLYRKGRCFNSSDKLRLICK